MSSLLNLSRTLALIKPNAIRHRSAIIRRIQMAGFQILQERCVKLTVEQATAFKCRVISDGEVPKEIDDLSSGPMIVLCLAREDAVEKWKELMGPENCFVAKESAPTCLRALYGDPDDELSNVVYGSNCDSEVKHELRFFFANMVLETIYGYDDYVSNYLCSVIYQHLTDALYEMTKVKPDDPLVWLANYMLEHNDNRPELKEVSREGLENLMRMKENEKLGTEQTDDDKFILKTSSTTCCPKKLP